MPPPAPPPPLHRCLPEEAWAWVDRQTAPVAIERVPLARASGRCLAAPVPARHALPSRPTAGIDGFAVNAASTLGASGYNPLPFRLHSTTINGVLEAAAAQPIAIGEPLPPGVDAVLAADAPEPDPAAADGAGLLVCRPVAVGEGVRARGEDCRDGETLLDAGRRLRAPDLALLRLLGATGVQVIGRPRVAVMCCRPRADDVDAEMLQSLVTADGGQPCLLEVHADGESLVRRLQGLDGVDVALCIGGTGLGHNDGAAAALAAAGGLQLRGVAIAPGDSLSLGQLADRPVCLLPRSPMACLGAYELVVGRLVRRLAGLDPGWPHQRCRARLTRKIAAALGSLQLCWVRLCETTDGPCAEPLQVAGEPCLRAAVDADGWVPVPLQREGYASGAWVDVYLTRI
ncbi:molybdopterin-binding protein [uncultured Thiohalocapsa sp.]|uniref:molybdopterin-binding protein n=1 Tax=uncultured Thiohalocapsa sp. TaxID=768990 RepID=UPI0025CE6323|nr:molybdopterin-binding protein [uncultured Thiohalocapsa sp.]